jgi:catechol 2,3-dioxygenase-like lactoylglutathione lyase family enzyme
VNFTSVHHVGLVTDRFERMRDFYVEVLGMLVIGGFPERQIVFLQAGSTRIELLGEDATPATPNQQAQGGWNHLALEVDDVDAAFAELVRRGVEIHSSPDGFPPEAPEFRIAFLRDPDGNLLELIQRIGGRTD